MILFWVYVMQTIARESVLISTYGWAFGFRKYKYMWIAHVYMYEQKVATWPVNVLTIQKPCAAIGSFINDIAVSLRTYADLYKHSSELNFSPRHRPKTRGDTLHWSGLSHLCVGPQWPKRRSGPRQRAYLQRSTIHLQSCRVTARCFRQLLFFFCEARGWRTASSLPRADDYEWWSG